MTQVSYPDIEAAAARIAGRVRPVTVASAQPGQAPAAPTSTAATWSAPPSSDPAGSGVHFALEFMQYTGSFKARGAQNFIQTHLAEGTLPDAGVTIASGGNAGLACAWAARDAGVPATVSLPCEEFVKSSGALASHAYDNPLIAAGAGTMMTEILSQIPDLDTIVVSVGSASDTHLLPASLHPENAGRFAKPQRLVGWRPKAVDPPGQEQSELDFVHTRGVKSRERREGS
ncbi:Pyridoxal-phosphate dependent enzyme [Brevibacterium sp. Mu109]|uniref:pyridoxal-phosphate dependent enzyme n=1 Tax=Brevibacterium sp. Mu109 TaxID=1255669 RepID=UPI000C4D2666|nr:pyridoxal-phosphate dependent enzyme [Brevibacterium sp. Mu109]SMY03230.1 Pyridoxal-phosphate dependent enzyme [Brevibacterium sp. Mu109]